MGLEKQVIYDTKKLNSARNNLARAKADVDKLAKNFGEYIDSISTSWRTDGGTTRKTEFENSKKNLENYSKSMDVLDGLIVKLIGAAEYANSISGEGE